MELILQLLGLQLLLEVVQAVLRQIPLALTVAQAAAQVTTL
jgi:hypothetical protein